MPVEVRRTDAGLELDLTGEWGIREFGDLQEQLDALDLGGVGQLRIDASGIRSLELSGAWALHEFVQRARAAGVTVAFRGQPPDQLRLLDKTLQDAATEAAEAEPAIAAASHDSAATLAPVAPRAPLLTAVGRHTVGAVRDVVEGLAFLGRVILTFIGTFGSLRRLRPISIARHVYDTGITAIPITALIAFLISVIIAYMSAQQLRGLGVDIYVVDLVTIGVLRELGVLLTSVIVAGRSGSAFAAELGSMKLNEEVDALIATGVDPFEVLVVPRIVGLVIALPLLTIIADLVGLTGGAVLCRYLLDMPLTQYLTRVNTAISPSTFWVGIIKAPVFAALIAIAGCYHGMQVRGSARELGRLVTVAVVQAIFFVILADALFAVLFMELNL